MAAKVIIPYLGEKVIKGIIGMWFKSEGDEVTKGEPICTIETDKASIEIEAPCSGILRRILCPRDAEVSIGDCIAIIGDKDEDISEIEKELRLR